MGPSGVIMRHRGVFKKSRPEAIWGLAAVFVILFFQLSAAAVEDSAAARHFYFVQITDTHWGRSDNLEKTAQAVDMINALPFPVECVVHTGDITSDRVDDAALVTRGKAVMNRLGVPVHYVPGNHDILKKNSGPTRAAYEKHFGPLISGATYKGVVFLFVCTEPLARSFMLEDYHPLKELQSTLEMTNGKPVIIFHHTPSADDFYNNKMHQRWSEEAQNAWVALLSAYNVKAVICGHFHRAEQHRVGDIPLYVAPSIDGAWGRQASFRIYEYQNGQIGYRTQYLEP